MSTARTLHPEQTREKRFSEIRDLTIYLARVTAELAQGNHCGGKTNPMKKFTSFTAGVDNQKLPGAGVKHLLINTIDNGRTDRVIKTTMRLLEASKFENLLVDSLWLLFVHGGRNMVEKISHNPSEPARKNGNNINFSARSCDECRSKDKGDRGHWSGLFL